MSGAVTEPVPIHASVRLACSGWRQWVVPGTPDVTDPIFTHKFQYRVNGSDPYV